MQTDRDRLIELIEDGFPVRSKIFFREDIEEIADYLLANGVILPPCKVGDKVYRIFNGEIYEYEVSNIVYRGLQSRWQIGCIPFLAYVYDELGKTVFLTKEEAEAKLKELWK